MSANAQIRSIIDTAKREHQRRSDAQVKDTEQHAGELSEQSRRGEAWLRTHVLPIVQELKQELLAEAIQLEIEENLSPTGHMSAKHFDGPSLVIRLLGTQRGGAAPASSARYQFHCDGEFLNISVRRGPQHSALGMPFPIESNPQEADTIVMEIVRRALTDYYETT
jgi:hypothetical protein